MVDYSDRLREAMLQAGYKTADNTPDVPRLAKAIGLTRQAVTKVVDGSTKFFTIPNHFKAARTLGVRPEWLGLGEAPMREPTQASAAGDVDWRTLAMSIASLHPHADVREQLLDFCDRVDSQAEKIRQTAAARAKTHTP